MAYNTEHGITPKTIKKKIEDIIERNLEESEEIAKDDIKIVRSGYNLLIEKDRKKYIKALEKQMIEYSERLEFEKAALVRDEINAIKEGRIDSN